MKKLKFIVTNYEVSVFPLYLLGEMLIRDFQKVFGIEREKLLLGEWKNRTNKWASHPETSNRAACFLIKKILKNHKFINRAIKNIYFHSNKLIKFSEKFIKENLKNKSDKELFGYYQEYVKRFKKMYVWAWAPNALEGQSDILSGKLKSRLNKELKKIGKEQLLGEYFSVLTTSTKETIREKEEKDLLKILKAKNKNKLLEVHTKKYCWIPFNYEGKPWNKNYFLKQLKLLTKQKIDSNRTKQILKTKQNKYIKELKIDKDYLYLFEVARQLSYIKDYRKNILYKSYYHLDKLIKEIARRLKLSPAQVRHILPSEIKMALINRDYSSGKLNDRIDHSVIIISKKETSIFSGKKAKKIVKNLVEQNEKKITKIKEIIGQTACGGKVKGIIKIIQETKDMNKMKTGDILVSTKTDPSLLPAMKKAAAIVTDSGGITCHAAIVSRELNIPCIIGTKIATRLLKDGNLVEVDADKGVVKII